ncbi:hypothetical protein G9U51_08250 [Calidifontibacter sp. DB0510]|uniref:DUF1983 domain-containing protein n=1 Tax=Metallococcus carri TaxID=1656884 RepID=A0A967B6T7_9MICO|nr:hypothetical protein [Metallococcus carri]NHN55766.1 hypothetical protein [Metallococcus carri]NOP38545.1 hypothetical protein [Calidifontibacter sp. DB2511S]
MTDPRVRRLAREIADLRKAQAAQNAPQLAASSIEDGAIEAYDRDGQLTLRVGLQHDGTHTNAVLAGPPPPAPAGLTATGGQLSATATWDGTFVGGAVAPMDLARIEVHTTTAAVLLPDTGPGSQTRVGTIEAPAGASVTFAAAPGEVWVWLVARSQAGKVSPPAGPAKVTVTSAVDPAIFAQLTKDLEAARARLADAEQRLTAAQAELDANDGRITQALADIAANKTAISDAMAGLAAAQVDLYQPGGTVDQIKTTLTAAQVTADAAQTTASGKNQILWSTADAPVSAAGTRTGDVWNKYVLAGNKTTIVASWTSDGTSWKPSGISETYVPQIAIGTGTYGELDGLRLKAKSVQANAILVDGSVGTVLIADGAVDATKVNAQSVAAATGAFIKLNVDQIVANSGTFSSAVAARMFTDIFTANKITANEIDVQSVAAATGAIMKLDVGQLTVTDTSSFAAAVVDRMWVNLFAAKKVTADQIDAGSVAAATGQFVKINADQINGGWLNASIAISSQGGITSGDWLAKCARMDGAGFSTYQVAEDGSQYLTTNLGRSDAPDTLSIYPGPNSPPVFEVTQDGIVTAEDAFIRQDPVIAGMPLLGQLNDANSDVGWLDLLPRGVIATADFAHAGLATQNFSTTGGSSLAYAGLGFISATVLPGRTYRVSMPYAYYVTSLTGGSTPARAGIQVTWTGADATAAEPANPTTSSTRLHDMLVSHTAATPTGSSAAPVAGKISFEWMPNVQSPTNVKLLVALAAQYCTMTSAGSAVHWRCTIEDTGVVVADTATLVAQSSQPPPKKTYTTIWRASDSQGYYGSGSVASFYTGKNLLPSGYYSSTTGNARSAIVFNGNGIQGEAKTISSALSGATLTKAEIYMLSLHWYMPTGGWARFTPLNGTTLPSTLASVTGTPVVSKKWTARVQGLWVTVPTSWFSGSKTGFVVGPAGDNSQANYGYFASHAHPTVTNRPLLRLTYTR